AQGAPEGPPRQGRLPQGGQEPFVRRRGRDDGHAQPDRSRESRHGHGAEERGPMTATVSEILEARRHTGDAPSFLTGAISLLAHGSFLVFLALISKPKPSTFVPQQIPIRIISPAALGRPAPREAHPVPAVPVP